jgi:signal recognition particle receptor subunit beta
VVVVVIWSADALIFVVDSSDVGRMEDAKSEFLRIVDDAEIKDAAVLVFANKSDLPKAASAAEVAELLDLGRLAQEGRPVHVQSACARSGEGLTEGIEWLTEQLMTRGKKPKKK